MQFSETRRRFNLDNSSKDRAKASPYMSHKHKTAEIRPHSKISPVPISFRENRTLSTIPYLCFYYWKETLSPPKEYFGKNRLEESKATFRTRKQEGKNISIPHDKSENSFNSYLGVTLDQNRTFLSRNYGRECGPNS